MPKIHTFETQIRELSSPEKDVLSVAPEQPVHITDSASNDSNSETCRTGQPLENAPDYSESYPLV